MKLLHKSCAGGLCLYLQTHKDKIGQYFRGELSKDVFLNFKLQYYN